MELSRLCPERRSSWNFYDSLWQKIHLIQNLLTSFMKPPTANGMYNQYVKTSDATVFTVQSIDHTFHEDKLPWGQPPSFKENGFLKSTDIGRYNCDLISTKSFRPNVEWPKLCNQFNHVKNLPLKVIVESLIVEATLESSFGGTVTKTLLADTITKEARPSFGKFLTPKADLPQFRLTLEWPLRKVAMAGNCVRLDFVDETSVHKTAVKNYKANETYIPSLSAASVQPRDCEPMMSDLSSENGAKTVAKSTVVRDSKKKSRGRKRRPRHKRNRRKQKQAADKENSTLMHDEADMICDTVCEFENRMNVTSALPLATDRKSAGDVTIDTHSIALANKPLNITSTTLNGMLSPKNRFDDRHGKVRSTSNLNGLLDVVVMFASDVSIPGEDDDCGDDAIDGCSILESPILLSPKIPKPLCSNATIAFIIGSTSDSESEVDDGDWDAAEALWDSLQGCEIGNQNNLHFERPPSPFVGGDKCDDEPDCYWQPSTPCQSYDRLQAVNSKWRSDMAAVDMTKRKEHTKKVRFEEGKALCRVHPLITWTYAYQAARKGQWEACARDRARFQRRIQDVGESIGCVLTPTHRRQVYEKLCGQ